MIGSRVLLSLLTLLGVGAVTASLNEMSHVDVTTISIPNERLSGTRIAVISDLHLTTFYPHYEKVAFEIRSLKPDILVIAGDSIENNQGLSKLERFLALLPNTPAVATLGNWERWGEVDIDALRDVYGRFGVVLLVNQCFEHRRDDQLIVFVGLDDFTAGTPDLDDAAKSCDLAAPTVVIQHSPGFFEQPTTSGYIRMFIGLSGHTHGGQVKLLGRAMWTPEGSGRFVEGTYETKLGTLFVTRGVGTSLIPLRLGSSPEIGLIDVH